MKKILFVLILIFVMSCDTTNPDLIVHNNTQTEIDSIRIYANENLPTTIHNFKPNEKKRVKILFDKDVFEGDGAYFLQIFNGEKVVRHRSFGYFTNGAALDLSFEIEIKNDTILVN